MKRLRLREAIHNILLESWDPIGVSGNPLAQNEYDSYIPGIERLLIAGADQTRLAQHLQRLERTSMGLSANPERNARVAARLLELVKGT